MWVGAAAIAVGGLLLSGVAVRNTGAHVDHGQAAFGGGAQKQRTLRDAFVHATLRDPVLRACNQAGLVNNLNDAPAWGLAPLPAAAPSRPRWPPPCSSAPAPRWSTRP